MSQGVHPEVWLRGVPEPGVPTLLLPVAHTLRQAAEDARRVADALPAAALWARPGGVASVGFHLRHLAGVTDRMMTYARGEALSEAQLAALAAEDGADEGVTASDLACGVEDAVEVAIAQLRATDPASLTEARTVGRDRIPTTHLGLLVHAAEHAMRHVGQMLVTARWAA